MLFHLTGDEIHDFLNFRVGDHGPLDTVGFPARSLEKHVALAEQFFRAHRIQNDAAVHDRRNLERDLGRQVRLDRSRNDVFTGSLRGDDEMDSGGAPFLGDTADGGFDIALGFRHHDVRELVDDDYKQRQLRRNEIVIFVINRFGIRGARVERIQVFCLDFRQHLITVFHFVDAPAQRERDLFRVVHDRGDQVGQGTVHLQFDEFRVDKDQFQVER